METIVETAINQNSVRMRPERLRTGREVAPESPVPMQGGVVAADAVAARVVRGIERRQLYILTHPEQREILRRRAARLDAVFEDGWGD